MIFFVDILIDQDIPFADALFQGTGRLIKKPGRHIVSEDLRGIDVLIVRSVTQVNAALLERQDALKFVGSVTSGDDHLDKSVLTQRGITYYTAKGCNAPAVVRYVLCAMTVLQRTHKLKVWPKIAIVGVGAVGGLLNSTLIQLGFLPSLYDPPRAKREQDFVSCQFSEVLKADLICLHVPLTQFGEDPTYHLIDEEIMQSLSQGTVVLNAARGAVVDNQAIKRAGQHLVWCLDVWENEPLIDLSVLRQAFIATPHIAGYSKESQQRGIYMVYEQVCRHFHLNLDHPRASADARAKIQVYDWQSAAFNYLDLFRKTRETKKTLERSCQEFDKLREGYRNLSEAI